MWTFADRKEMMTIFLRSYNYLKIKPTETARPHRVEKGEGLISCNTIKHTVLADRKPWNLSKNLCISLKLIIMFVSMSCLFYGGNIYNELEVPPFTVTGNLS